MKRTSLAHIVASALLLAPAAFAAETEAGFQPIFNNKDLAGWDGNAKLWSVKDGAIVGRTTAEAPLKGNTFLIWTNGNPADFELRCSFKIEANNDAGFANSGIQYRSKVLDPANWVVGGYQADMEYGPTYTGILYEERMTRGIMAARGEKVVWNKDCEKQVTGSVGKSEEIQAAVKKGDWNDYVVIAKGNHLQHFINGKQTVDVTDECESKRASSGVLALQLHAGQPMTVQFRNLRIKTLSGGSSSDTAAEEIRKLQGIWHVTAAEANGDNVPSEDVTNIVVTIKDATYEAKINEGTDHGTFSIDPTTTPKQMDVHPKTGEDEGRTLRAIYEVKGETMRIIYGRNGTRPTSFDTSGDAGFLMLNYKRQPN
jgi:uncharacterized protein (TIGR03067 family)